VRPDALALRTGGACDLDPQHLLDVVGEQRRRLVAALEEFGPDDWAAPTRCAEWSAHDVVRHLCDANGIIQLGPGDRTLDVSAGFDPRTSPRGFLAASAGEPPRETLARLVATSEDLLVVASRRLAEGRSFDVFLPFGPMDWTVLVLHGLWDAWVHERDVMVVRGAEHPSYDDATFYAAAYGLFIAGVVASVFAGDEVREQLALGGPGGGVFDVDVHGAVVVTATRATVEGPPAAVAVDALAGRSPIDQALPHVAPSSRTALGRMADFFNTPVEPGSN
jgi:uncharacterized protein (TIGR03083 family)